jgi:hypothetical protein
MNKKPSKAQDKDWSTMSLIERAIHCEKIAEDYQPGFCKDQVLSQARRLRAMAKQETDIKNAEGA